MLLTGSDGNNKKVKYCIGKTDNSFPPKLRSFPPLPMVFKHLPLGVEQVPDFFIVDFHVGDFHSEGQLRVSILIKCENSAIHSIKITVMAAGALLT